MDLLEHGSTSGLLQLDLENTVQATGVVHVLTVSLQAFPPLWEMTSSVRVATLDQIALVDFMQMTRSGMVRAVELLPAVS